MDSPAAVEPNVQQVVPMFGVASMEASLRFYVDGLGFEMTNRWIDEGTLRWCWLQLGDAALMLQEYRTEWAPKGPVGEGVSLNFVCRDALAIYHEVGARGIPAAKKPFVGNGMWVVEFTDPDGYQVYFESVTDVPEGTEYAEVQVEA
jgi:catechol 2,3-dioxygenase-like lactoylglutathione lyase family enzyme